MTLAEKGLPYRGSVVDLAHIPTRVRELNPGGTVPIIQDHGSVVYGSRAICEYLEERYPTPHLMPRTPFKRARVRMLWDFCDSEVIDASPKELLLACKRLEMELGRSLYLVENFSLADLAFAPFLLQAPKNLRRQFPPNVSRWVKELLSHLSVAEDSILEPERDTKMPKAA
jgi:glutathione S-transferase